MNLAPLISALRHAGTYTAGLVTGLALLGMKHDDAVALADALTNLAKGSAEVLAGIGVITPLVTTYFASRSATSASQVKSIQNMTAAQANEAVASLPADAKSQIKLAVMPDKAIVAAAAALPDVAAVVVKHDAGDGVAAAAADPSLPKVVKEGT